MEPVELLNQFLHEDLPRLASNERVVFDLQVGDEKKVIIYGCGKLGRVIAEGLTRVGKPPVAFADANQKLLGAEQFGIPVLSPLEAIETFGQTHTFVVTVLRDYDKVKKNLIDTGAQHVVHFLPLLWKYPYELLPYYNFDLPSKMLVQAEGIKKAFTLFADEASQKEFVFQLQWMTSLSCFNPPCCSPAYEQYFPVRKFDIGTEEVFVDCGAFTGDTIETFRKRAGDSFRQIVAIEPDPVNLKQLARYLSLLPKDVRSKIRVEPFGLGSENETTCFNATGSESSSFAENGTLKIKVKRLDDLLATIAPTYIKMDIEGAELNALRGARETIRKYQPRIATCVYHVQEHLWEVPLEMNRINPAYFLSLCRYRDEFGDVVCYAAPKKT